MLRSCLRELTVSSSHGSSLVALLSGVRTKYSWRVMPHSRQTLVVWHSVRSFASKRNSKKGGRRFDRVTNETSRKAKPVVVETTEQRARGEENEESSRSWIPLVAAGIGVYVAGVWLAMKITGFKLFKEEDPSTVTEELRRQAFDKGARTYDEEVCSGEWLMGISNLRKRLLALAEGEVLEVAAGTGHNFPLYAPDCRITATDCSESMLEVAPECLQASRSVRMTPMSSQVASQKANRSTGPVTLKVMDAEALSFPDASFDTVVDTFGLCSVQHPERTLREMQRVCRSGGRVLLLEHGTSSWSFVASLLDGWNRDILALVKASDMKIVQLEQHHLGTTYWIVAEPNKPGVA